MKRIVEVPMTDIWTQDLRDVHIRLLPPFLPTIPGESSVVNRPTFLQPQTDYRAMCQWSSILFSLATTMDRFLRYL